MKNRSNSASKHLWWTIPVAVVLGLPLWVVAGLSWCGISGCSGGGFGVDSRFVGTAIACAIAAGSLMSIAIVSVPWFHSFSGRLLIALGIGAAYAALGAIITQSH